MAQEFNVQPYWDDFDPSKNYHRILFKPGYAVQARELTQSQTILQNQISNFASSIFSQNTPVSGGKVTVNLNCSYLKLNTQYNNSNIVASAFLNKVIMDVTGTILAKVVATTESTGTGGDPPTLFITYISGTKFSDGLSIFDASGLTNLAATTIGIAGGSTCTGLSSVASISTGVFYIVDGQYTSGTENSDGTYSTYTIGNFVSVSPQTIVLDKYDNSPSLRVGLQIVESVIDSVDDASLLDPAIGASNYQAPGADRYQITLSLVTLPLTLGNDDQFIELVRISNGSIIKQVDGTVYSTIDDYFAKRDYETNGDYVVNDFTLTPTTDPLDPTSYYLNIGPGIAYVRGYRIENQSNLQLTNARARTINSVNTNNVFMDYGNYFIVDTLHGTFDITTMPAVDLHCVPAANINSTNNTTYASTLVGTSFMRNLAYITDAGSANTAAYVFKAYVTDISTNTLSGNAASGGINTITFYDPTDKFSTSANAYFGVTVKLVGGTSAGDTRSVVSYNNSTKTITVDNPFTFTPDTTTQFTLVFGTPDIESIVKTSGTTTPVANANINISGKVGGSPNGDTIYENISDPEMLQQIGYPYVANVNSTSYTSTRDFRNYAFSGSNTITLSIGTLPFRFLGTGSLSDGVIKQLFTLIDTSTNNVINFTSSSNSTITISGGGTVATLVSPNYAGKTVNIIATVSVYNADNSSYVLKYKNLTLGNTVTATGQTGPSGNINANTYIDLTNGQVYIKNAVVANSTTLSLYVTDIKQIKKIIDTGNPATVVTSAMLSSSAYDITSHYTLNNGQKDNYYDFGSVTLLPGAPSPLGNILVIFDYYAHTGGDGYFSVQSYLASAAPESYPSIPAYQAKNGDYYKLSDSVDFRPSRKNAQAAYIWEATTSTNDAGILIPQDVSEFVCNYGYYLARNDKLVLTKDKLFTIIQGTPSVQPSFPAAPDGALVLATLSHDPYTAYVPGEGPVGITSNLSINKIPHKRWAKSDITDLQTRVNNLEYYTSLSVLEQNAQALQIPDVNGLNRFKNGILVDDFSTFSTADTNNSDFQANINIRTQQLLPLSVINNFQLHNPIVLGALGTLSNTNTFAVSSIGGTTTNVFTLPYTLANVAVQPLASSAIALNPFSVPIQQGYAWLEPPMDNWVDTTQAPAVLVTDPSMQVSQQTFGINLTNAGDFASIPGTQYTTTSLTATQLAGGVAVPSTTYSSQVPTSPSSSASSSVLNNTNGFITNSAILSYIRPQQIGVRVMGMQVNTPVSVYFDGVNINQYMTAPNTIELTGVKGTFNLDDIVGFYSGTLGTFNPIARVLSVYNYPGTANTRLYVSDIISVNATVIQTTTIQNGFYNSSGVYTSTTANGTVKGTGTINLSASGDVTSVGGTFSSVIDTTVPGQTFYNAVPDYNYWCSFLIQNGVWSTPTPSATTFTANCPVQITQAGTYTLIASADNTATINIDGVSTLTAPNYGYTSTATKTLTVGIHYITWTATRWGRAAGFALVIKDPNGNIVFNAKTPPSVTYTAAGNMVAMPGGGTYYEGVTQIALDPAAANTTSFYVGSPITVTTKYIQ